MKLNMTKRTAKSKGDAKRYRREGKIPAVLYAKGKPAESLVVSESEFDGLVRNVKKNRLSTTKVTLVDEAGKERRAILKDIQYHITTYRVIHLDFEELLEDQKVKVNVPIEPIGAIDCVGIKLGGVLRQVIRNLKVQCFPKDMPEALEVDVKSLELNETKKLKDLNIPSQIRPLMDLNEVCVVIAKR